MKTAITSLLFSLFLLTGCEKDKVVDDAELPGAAKEFVETHYPAATIKQVVKERDDLQNTYDVILDNQVKLSFDNSGACYEAESPKTLKLPDSMIPTNMLEYVTTNYPDAFIIEWDKDKTDQEIKLNTNVELIFNLSGGFLRVDN